jgi:hypothetical protein
VSQEPRADKPEAAVLWRGGRTWMPAIQKETHEKALNFKGKSVYMLSLYWRFRCMGIFELGICIKHKGIQPDAKE